MSSKIPSIVEPRVATLLIPSQVFCQSQHFLFPKSQKEAFLLQFVERLLDPLRPLSEAILFAVGHGDWMLHFLA
jgi:hypothetical protein